VLIAVDEQNKRLIVGLHADNVERLRNDQPIEKKLGETPGLREAAPELAEWTLFILGPEDLERFVARYAGATS
jgi:hypothetical protein